jgi:hypothetical protein
MPAGGGGCVSHKVRRMFTVERTAIGCSDISEVSACTWDYFQGLAVATRHVPRNIACGDVSYS